MSICFTGYGSITLKKETAQDFADKFKELLSKSDENARFMCNEEGLLQFESYARHYFIDECKALIENNIEKINEGRIWFNCDDEDGNPNAPFPFRILIEIVDGKLYEESLNTRLDMGWEHYNADIEWFC